MHTLAPDRHKINALDGVRGIAILVVMANHYNRFVPNAPFLDPLKFLAGYGGLGVDLFFALSGFLITGVLLASRSSTNYFGSFYARRTLRIFPIYYLTLIAVFLVAPLFPAGLDRVPVPHERPLYFLYLSNWIGVWKNQWPPNVVGHFWSLAIEEQFYLVWPLCVFFLGRRALRITAISLSVLALVARIVWIHAIGPSTAVYLATFTRMDDLLIGSFCAIVFAERGDARGLRLGAWIVAPLGLFVAGVFLLGDNVRESVIETLGFSAIAVGFSALILALAFGDDTRSLLQRVFSFAPLRRIGLYSYGMYVYHVPILGLCELLLLRRLPGALTASPGFAVGYVCFLAVVTFAVAAVSYEVIERPILGLKRFFRPTHPLRGDLRPASG